MEKKNSLTLDLIQEHISKIVNSPLPNPIYGKNIFFFEGCVKPRLERNQLFGYLGVFSGSNELNNEVDICVIPLSSYKMLKDGESDDVINEINEKMNSHNKETNRYTNAISNTLIIPEKKLFAFIKEKLLKDDKVKINQFNRINFNYKL